MIRKAVFEDIERLAEIYEEIHAEEEAGRMSVGWQKGVYPTGKTALLALERGDLFVEEDEAGKIVAGGVINQIQVPEYADAAWEHAASPEKVMVLHMLTVSPKSTGRGYAKNFVRYYEEYALAHDCPFLRMDTQEKNTAARRLYAGLGYKEADIVDCDFNGIPGVKLVCLEKKL
ncbi:MAG: GNAT family N-acetyltransferase [Eubacteriales bacterium]|nr:GNAT family N-acetyltransferase [Eubacteriales bacterium]